MHSLGGAIDLIEHMFEYEGMAAFSSLAAVSALQPAWGEDPARPEGSASARGHRSDARAGVVDGLREQMRQLQPALFPARELPTHPALSALLPGGSLRAGGVYVVAGSYSVALTALAGASTAGQWVAAVGFPHLGVEAAIEMGVDVERLVLVPDPSADWLAVTVALIDTVSVVLVNAPRGVDDATASRLASRLRQRECVLVVVGQWPHPEARLAVERRQWLGVGRGHGHLAQCGIGVAAWDRLGRFSERGCVLSSNGMSATAGGGMAGIDPSIDPGIDCSSRESVLEHPRRAQDAPRLSIVRDRGAV